MQFDLLISESRSIVMVDCELVRIHRRLEAGWVAMAPGNYRPVEWLKAQNGLLVGVQIPVNIRSRIVPATICDPNEAIFFELDKQFARDFFT